MRVALSLPTWEGPDGRVVAFEGRLDNRTELVSRFGHADGSDAQLAWAAWREGRLDLLLGDWILVVWAPAEQRLWLARDPVGLRRLFYRRDGETLWLSTALRPLVRSGDDWDQRYLYRFLQELPLGNATPYKAIRAVPRGRLLELTADQERLEAPLWNPWAAGPLRLSRPEEYVEQFCTLLTESVRTRLHSAGSTVGLTLSGGLDSGSVGALAAQLIERGEAPMARIHPIFYRYEAAEAAELTYLEANAGRIGVQPEMIPAESLIRNAWSLPATMGTDLPITNLMGWPIIVEAARRFRAAGVQTVLSGRGGDALLSGYPEMVLDLLASGRWGRAMQYLQAWATEVHVGPLLLLRRLLAGRPWAQLADDQPDWFAWAPRGEEPALPAVPRWVSRAQRAAHAAFWSAPEEGGSAWAELGLTESWPLLDRRLLEFTFRVDRSLLESPTETKSLLRAAMRGIMPEAVRLRRSKSVHSGLMLTWFRHQRPFFEELLRSGVGAPFDFLRPETVANELRLITQGKTNGLLLVNLYALLVWMAEVEAEARGRDSHAADGWCHLGLPPALGRASGGSLGL